MKKTMARTAKKSTTSTTARLLAAARTGDNRNSTPFDRVYKAAGPQMRRLLNLALRAGVDVGIDVERGFLDMPGLV